MDHNPFDPSENSGEPHEQAGAGEGPTAPGLDPTGPGAGGPPPPPSQPKWQPLPEGNWAPPSPPAPPPPWTVGPGGYGQEPAPGWVTPPYAPGQQGSAATPPYGAAAQGGYSPPPYGGYGPPRAFGDGPGAGGHPGESGPPRRRGRIIAAATAVAVLVAGAATAGAIFGSRASNTSNRATQPIPQPQSSGTSAATKLNVAGIAKNVDPATVDITSVLGAQNAEAEGTGMVLTSNGEVLTNNHVIQGATKITAQVDGTGTTYQVKVLGADPTADVALVLLEGASGLPHVSIGNSSTVSVGDGVVAIGNALGLGGTPTVTSGIVSALGRSITASDAGSGNVEHLTGLIQTDAPINPGNSGGPLVNAAGQVIGMDTAAATGSSTQSASNIGFAIPIDRAIGIATKIQQHKASSQIILGTHGIMGVDVESIATAEQQSASPFGGSTSFPVNYGAVVLQVLGGSPAARAGIRSGDVIIGLNGKKVSSYIALGKMLTGAHPGTTVSVTWVGGSGGRHTASLTLMAGPAV